MNPNWTELAHARKPPGFWRDSKNQYDFMTEVAKKLDIKKPEDWYKVTVRQVLNLGGGNLMHVYNGSLAKALQTIFPEVQWSVRNFKQVPKGYWKDIKNQRDFMTEVAQKLNVKTSEDWYNVTSEQVADLGGEGLLLHYYNGSLVKALQTIFPGIQWNIWNFQKVPRRYWNSRDNIRSFMTDLAKRMSFKKDTDWNYLTNDQLNGTGAGRLLHLYGSIPNILKFCFPELNYKKSNMQTKVSKGQGKMDTLIGDLFPKHSIISNYKTSDIRFSRSGKNMEIDVFIPTLALAFEYQGQQHYGKGKFPTTSNQRRNDEEKRKLCKEYGITLIEIPFWWNGTDNALKATIASQRPDLNVSLHSSMQPISNQKLRESKQSIVPDHYEVHVTKGKPICRGCRTPIEQGIPRIVCKAHSKINTVFKVQICLNIECIQKAPQNNTKYCTLEPFQNEIHVPKHMEAFSLPELPNVKYIKMP